MNKKIVVLTQGLQKGREIDIDELLKVKLEKGLRYNELMKEFKLTEKSLKEVTEVMRIEYPGDYETYMSFSKRPEKVSFDDIMEYLKTGPKTRKQIMDRFDITGTTLNSKIQKMKDKEPEKYLEFLNLIKNQRNRVVKETMQHLYRTRKQVNNGTKLDVVDSTQKSAKTTKQAVKKTTIKEEKKITPAEAIALLKEIAKNYNSDEIEFKMQSKENYDEIYFDNEMDYGNRNLRNRRASGYEYEL